MLPTRIDSFPYQLRLGSNTIVVVGRINYY